MQESDFKINLPMLETVRRSCGYVFTNLSLLFKVSASWCALLLLFDMFNSFPSLCSLSAMDCEGSWAQNISSIAISFSSVAVIVAYIRHIVMQVNYSGFWNLNFAKREIRYILAGCIFIAIIALPALVYGFVAGLLGAVFHLDKLVFTPFFLILLLAMLIICSRFYLVFPAIALDNREMTFKKSFQITKGNSNKIFWGQVLMIIPVFIALLILSLLYRVVGSDNYLVKMLFSCLMLLITFVDACLKAAYFAHIYQYFIYFYQKRVVEVPVLTEVEPNK